MIRVQTGDFDVGAELAGFAAGNGRVGATCVFVGTVRDYAAEHAGPGGWVTAMTLEHYPGMTETRLAAIEAEARRRWPLEDVLIVHRYGRLEAGDRIVMVAAASGHREAAFQACQFLIDWLKTKAPFWKLEHTADGDSWVDARDLDDALAARWDG
ncbi:MAG: molybdenum cofactor biosynthesis protein MoaE [Magnetospirillum sp.]|nr:molybdenum cofactor biosynthesis protein MoaE [Magnetospirillum sp.]